MTELKPCPKCNGDSFTARVCGGVAAFGCAEYVYEVECSCGLSFCVDCSSETKEEAEREGIEAWNTRAEQTCKNRGGHMGCSECGWYLNENARYYDGCGAKVVD